MIADPGHIRSQHEAAYEALADLFLGELSQVAAHDAALGVKPSHERRTHAAVGTHPHLHLVTAEPADRPEAFDAPTGPGSSLAPMQIEALVLGHLPVIAGAWAGQYVRHVAQRSTRPVALVRLCGASIRIELHDAGAPTDSRPQTFVAAGSLTDAVAVLCRQRTHVVLHVDPHEEAPLAAACAAASTHGMGIVTMLTSADDAGIVGAYQTITRLSRGIEAGQGLHDTATLNVVIMGAPEARAQYVWRRLQEATETFLGIEISLAACIKRIGSGPPGRVVYEGPFTAGAVAVTSLLTTAPTTEPAAAAVPQALTLPAGAKALVTPDARIVEAPAAPQPASQAGAVGPRADSGSVPTGPSALAACLPGLTILRARCPHAEDVELAVDAEGLLHLLARYRTDEPDHRVVERLHAAACWARVHAKVLSLTLPGEGAGTTLDAASPTRHLFTDRPAEHRALFDSDVRMHLLVAVPREHASPWVCAAVN
ncbi:MAG: hypothetical protein ACKVS8_03090 [Phycisphaerales bacterium]